MKIKTCYQSNKYYCDYCIPSCSDWIQYCPSEINKNKSNSKYFSKRFRNLREMVSYSEILFCKYCEYKEKFAPLKNCHRCDQYHCRECDICNECNGYPCDCQCDAR